MHVLEVENLIRNYQKSALKKSDEDIKVLKGLNFSVEQGEFVGIMGKSGCGKTTLLKVLGMIDKQTDGVVRFMEKDTSKLYGDELADIRREQIGFVFQDFYLMDSLSVEENIMLPMHHAAHDPGAGEGRRDDESCQKVCRAVPDQPSAEEESL